MKIFKTTSDAGSVRIGNDYFKVLVPNGYGDGCTVVIVGEYEDEDAIAEDGGKFWSIINGKDFSVYCSDCGNEDDVATTLSGKYYVYILGDTKKYINKGAVAFIKSSYSD